MNDKARFEIRISFGSGLMIRVKSDLSMSEITVESSCLTIIAIIVYGPFDELAMIEKVFTKALNSFFFCMLILFRALTSFREKGFHFDSSALLFFSEWAFDYKFCKLRYTTSVKIIIYLFKWILEWSCILFSKNWSLTSIENNIITIWILVYKAFTKFCNRCYEYPYIFDQPDGVIIYRYNHRDHEIQPLLFPELLFFIVVKIL